MNICLCTVGIRIAEPGSTRWSNVPSNVWGYKLGGYQVLKKWLSYRESKVLENRGRPRPVFDGAPPGRKVQVAAHHRRRTP